MLLDLERKRLDIAQDGAKLIVRLSNNNEVALMQSPEGDHDCPSASHNTELKVGDLLAITGILKKEQRRTFLEATKLLG